MMLNAKYSDDTSSHLIKKAKKLIQSYNLKDQITLITDYLSDAQTLQMLRSADLVVYPYKYTQESSSAAIRMAIAAQTNIAVTPQPIFDEVKEFAFVFDGDSVEHLVTGLNNFIDKIAQNGETIKQMHSKREKFRNEVLYSKLSKQIKEMLH